jgi:hypothetical protein
VTIFRRRGDIRPMPWSERLYRRFFLKYHGRYLITDLQMRAKQQSLDYIEAEMGDALIFADRWDLLAFAAREAPETGLLIECGVADGASLRHLAGATARPLHGFDSFEGLPEHWAGTFERKGKFGRGGALPEVPANVTLHKGWFEQTLPPFLAAHRDDVAFLHIDCDIYSSTVTIFGELGLRLRPGSVIVFDEYFNYPSWQRHEWRAFQEFLRESGFSYRYLGFAQKNGHVAVKLGEKSEAARHDADARLARWSNGGRRE